MLFPAWTLFSQCSFCPTFFHLRNPRHLLEHRSDAPSWGQRSDSLGSLHTFSYLYGGSSAMIFGTGWFLCLYPLAVVRSLRDGTRLHWLQCPAWNGYRVTFENKRNHLLMNCQPDTNTHLRKGRASEAGTLLVEWVGEWMAAPYCKNQNEHHGGFVHCAWLGPGEVVLLWLQWARRPGSHGGMAVGKGPQEPAFSCLTVTPGKEKSSVPLTGRVMGW